MGSPGRMARELLRRWHNWSSQTTNRRIFAAASSVSAATLLVSIAHLTRELAVAREFGRTEAVDAFLIAFLLPSFAINVVGGALGGAFIPAYVGLRENQGREAANALLQTLSTMVAGALILVAGLLALCGHRLVPFLGSGFSPETLELTVQLLRLLVPVMVLLGVSRLWAAALNAQGSFLMVALAPIFTPLLSFLSVLLLSDSLGISALAYGVVGGSLIEVVLLGILLRAHGLPVGPRWRRGDVVLHGVGPQVLLLMFASALLNSTTAVDQAMAAMLAPGSVAALGYGEKLPRLLMNLGAMSLGTAAMPFLSEMVARRDFAAVRHTLKHFARLVLLVSVPVISVLALGSGVIVRLIFQRGAFSAADTAVVASVQAFYLLQTPLALTGVLFGRLLVSWRRAGLLLLFSVLALVANVCGNLLFMRWLGVAGIALSTAVVALLSTGTLVLTVSLLLKRQQEA